MGGGGGGEGAGIEMRHTTVDRNRKLIRARNILTMAIVS